jgi:diguanylate cyclase
MNGSLASFRRGEVRLALMMSFGVCAGVGILPFAIWRFSEGQWIIGLFDLAVMVGLFAIVWAGWRYQRVDGAARCMVVLATAACFLLAPLNSKLIVFWTYTVVVGNLLLAGRHFGLAASFCLVAGLSLLPGVHESLAERLTFALTASLATLYAFVFAVMTDGQRAMLESMATDDPLTGAGNRRMMEADLAESFSLAERYRLQSALAVVDLDDFKIVNDTYGHEAGDEILRQFVGLTREVMRSDDALYRMGGEEFVLFLPHTGQVSLLAFLDRLQAHLHDRLVGPGGPVTVSMGAAVIRPEDDGWTAWLARADGAMYRAKREGRDRYCIAPARRVYDDTMAEYAA